MNRTETHVNVVEADFLTFCEKAGYHLAHIKDPAEFAFWVALPEVEYHRDLQEKFSNAYAFANSYSRFFKPDKGSKYSVWAVSDDSLITKPDHHPADFKPGEIAMSGDDVFYYIWVHEDYPLIKHVAPSVFPGMYDLYVNGRAFISVDVAGVANDGQKKNLKSGFSFKWADDVPELFPHTPNFSHTKLATLTKRDIETLLENDTLLKDYLLHKDVNLNGKWFRLFLSDFLLSGENREINSWYLDNYYLKDPAGVTWSADALFNEDVDEEHVMKIMDALGDEQLIYYHLEALAKRPNASSNLLSRLIRASPDKSRSLKSLYINLGQQPEFPFEMFTEALPNLLKSIRLSVNDVKEILEPQGTNITEYLNKHYNYGITVPLPKLMLIEAYINEILNSIDEGKRVVTHER